MFIKISETASASDSSEKKDAFIFSFIHQWNKNLQFMMLLSGGSAAFIFEEILRTKHLTGYGSITLINLMACIFTGAIIGIVIGRWTAQIEFKSITKEFDPASNESIRLSLSECIPWGGFICGFVLCFCLGIPIRLLFSYTHFIEPPSVAWGAPGTVATIHGIIHLLWWNIKKRNAILILLSKALDLKK